LYNVIYSTENGRERREIKLDKANITPRGPMMSEAEVMGHESI
jgi:hypothetical protein